VESGEATKLHCLQEPFIQPEEAKHGENNGSIRMVLLSTLVAVCGSFTFGTCVSIDLKQTIGKLQLEAMYVFSGKTTERGN